MEQFNKLTILDTTATVMTVELRNDSVFGFEKSQRFLSRHLIFHTDKIYCHKSVEGRTDEVGTDGPPVGIAGVWLKFAQLRLPKSD